MNYNQKDLAVKAILVGAFLIALGGVTVSVQRLQHEQSVTRAVLNNVQVKQTQLEKSVVFISPTASPSPTLSVIKSYYPSPKVTIKK